MSASYARQLVAQAHPRQALEATLKTDLPSTLSWTL